MVTTKNNPKGKMKKCALCDKNTDKFIKAHIPRGGKQTYLVGVDCELTLNEVVS